MISKYISLVTAVIELFLFGGIFTGYSFLQYILVEELILNEELCDNQGEILCEDALQFYSFIYTCAVIAGASGAVVIGMIEVKVGMFNNRVMCNLMTSSGLICLALYQFNGYLVLAGWVLISFPSVYYIVSNIWIASHFPAIGSLIVVTVSAVFDMSAGLFLLFKIAYDEYGAELDFMLQILAASSVLIWIRTFALVPYKKHNSEKSVFEQSFIYSLCVKSEDSKAQATEDDQAVTFQDIVPAIKSFNLWQFTAYYTLLGTRTESIQGWIYPWMNWVYAGHDADDTISSILNLFGYSNFFSPLIALFPGLLAAIMKKVTKSEFTANFYSLIVLMTMTCSILVANSIQMCYQAIDADDTVNSIVFMVLFTMAKIWIYTCPHLFIFTFYPIEQYSFIYALLTLPTIAFHWITEPLYSLIINGDDIANADFVPVSIGFAIACGLSSLSIVYTFIVGRKLVKEVCDNSDHEKLNDKHFESSL